MLHITSKDDFLGIDFRGSCDHEGKKGEETFHLIHVHDQNPAVM